MLKRVSVWKLTKGIALISLAGLTLAIAPAPRSALAAPVAISGFSMNPDGGDPNDPLAVTECNGAPQSGVVYRNSESEPTVAVNPTNHDNMIAGWHQDRWSTGGGQSLGAAYSNDGGATWTQVVIPFTRCAGAAIPRPVIMSGRPIPGSVSRPMAPHTIWRLCSTIRFRRTAWPPPTRSMAARPGRLR